jgi:hypothetical protein
LHIAVPLEFGVLLDPTNAGSPERYFSWVFLNLRKQKFPTNPYVILLFKVTERHNKIVRIVGLYPFKN